jgi:hypothetical protein
MAARARRSTMDNVTADIVSLMQQEEEVEEEGV